MERVWLWEDLKSWEQPLWNAIGDIVSRSVVQRVRKNPPKYLVGDDLSWLDDRVHDVSGQYVDTKLLCAGRLQTLFEGVRAYHGTRTADVGQFYSQGMLPLDAECFEERARQIFLTPEFPELTREGVDKAITSVGRDLRHGSLFFDLHKRELVECGSHYMLYGSEYVTAIAAHIEGPRDYRQALKHFGVPTLFVCNVPFSLMHPGAIADFAGQAIRVLFERVMDKDYYHPQAGEGGGIVIKSPLAPKFIVSHSHPELLKDPFLNYRPVWSPQ